MILTFAQDHHTYEEVLTSRGNRVAADSYFV